MIETNMDASGSSHCSAAKRPRVSISFSGGRSSAVMTKMILDRFKNTAEIVVTFANTGCEHEATLQFVRDCDENWGFNTVWIEAIIGGEGVGPRANVVSFETASRDGKPFEAAIKKHGIFNPAMPNCTGRLKVEPMWAYLRDYLGWSRGECITAIGIRADECDRCNPKWREQGLWYPLVEWGIGRKQVNAMMKMASFDLKLPGDHYGNCVWCWKKTDRKLLTVAKHNPEVFDFPKRMEELYGNVKPTRIKDEPRWCEEKWTFFRKGRSTQDMLDLAAAGNFEEYRDKTEQLSFPFWDDEWDNDLDVGGGCGDSCEIGADDRFGGMDAANCEHETVKQDAG